MLGGVVFVRVVAQLVVDITAASTFFARRVELCFFPEKF